MANPINIQIADVNFVIGSSFDIFHTPGKAYRKFLGKRITCSGDRSININIDLKAGDKPIVKSMHKIFDSEQSWAIYQNTQQYCITWHPPRFKKSTWTALIDKNFLNITIYCGSPMIQKKIPPTIINPVCYPLDQILLMHALACGKGCLCHSAGAAFRGSGYLFPGKSGMGKTTLTSQFLCKNDFEFFSDDRIIIRKLDQTFTMYGTPWPGDAGIAENKKVTLNGIFFINHGSTNRVKTLTSRQALERLVPVTSIPWYDRDIVPKLLDFFEDLVLNVPAYELDFKPSVEVVDVLEQFISR